MEEEIKVDKKELKKQIRDELLEGPHARLEIVVPKINSEEEVFDCYPSTEIEMTGATSMSLALLVKLLDDVKEQILNHDITVMLAYMYLGEIGEVGSIDMGDEKDEAGD